MNSFSPMYAGGPRQPYAHSANSPGEPTRDPITTVQYKIGQIGPRAENFWNMTHGRHLAGLGGLNETQQPWDDVPYQSGALRELEKEDDAYGSGIFDTYGREGTVNPNMGVFADHPSLPGYIDRERQYTVSRDVYDITSGAEVVVVPGGGMTYQERGGFSVPFDRSGQAPCPPRTALSRPTNLDTTYVSTWPRPGIPGPQKYTGRFVPLPGPAGPRATPDNTPQFTTSSVVPNPSGTPVPLSSAMNAILLPPGMTSLVPKGNISNYGVTSYPAGQSYNPRGVPFSKQGVAVGSRQIVNDGAPQDPVPGGVQGFGADDSAPGWGTYAFAGLLVGGAAALLYGAMNIKTR